MAKLVSLGNLERFRSNMAESVWESIASAADGTTITYDAATKKLSAGGSSVGASASGILPYCNATELEDLTIRTGSFTNSGEGWNTFAVPEPFEGAPHVILTVESGYSVEIMTVTAESFLYKVTAGSASNATTGNYYVFTSQSTSSSYMVQIPIVTSIGGAETTADPVEIKWTAVEYGGE